MSRCKARKRYMKQFVQARHSFAASHVMYIRSLRTTGSAVLQFANAEITTVPHHHLPPEPHPIRPCPPPRAPSPRAPSPMPPPLPPMSPSSDAWTSMTASPALPLPPPPPPPPPPASSSGWDFWDPFVPPPPSSSRSVTEEEWEATTTTGSEIVATTTAAASVMAPPSAVSGFSKGTPSSDLAMVVSRNTKDLVEITKELDFYFIEAAKAGAQVSLLLEVPTSGFSNQSKGSKKPSIKDLKFVICFVL